MNLIIHCNFLMISYISEAISYAFTGHFVDRPYLILGFDFFC